MSKLQIFLYYTKVWNKKTPLRICILKGVLYVLIEINYFLAIEINSTSNSKVDFGGITGGYPLSP